MLAVGDSKGIIRVFQVTHDRALLLATHELLEISSKEDSIVEIFITSDEQYAIVAFESGLICCYDVKNSFNFIGHIERDAQRFCYSSQLQVQMAIIEDRKTSATYGDMSIMKGTSRSAFNLTMRVISTISPNCVSVSQVDIKGSKLHNKTPLAQFIIDEGKIAGFDVHPSKDYILVTSNQGRIYVFRLDTGELRGTITCPLHAKGCLIDPSGLYVIIQVPPFSPKMT
jgi:WD40 repeat protein